MKLSFSTGLVEGLQYLTITRPDTSFAVNRVCQFIQHPTDKHWGAIKRILKYFKGSINLGLHFQKSSRNTLSDFSNADEQDALMIGARLVAL